MKKPRTERALVDKRVQLIARMIAADAKFSDVWAQAQAEGWNVTRSQVWRYHRAARALIAAAAAENHGYYLGLCLTKLQRNDAAAFNAGDYNASNDAIKEFAKLAGLYPAAESKTIHEQRGSVRVDVFQRVAEYADVLDQLSERNRELPQGPVPGEHLRELLAEGETDPQTG
jgi:hypothetical protein